MGIVAVEQNGAAVEVVGDYERLTLSEYGPATVAAGCRNGVYGGSIVFRGEELWFTRSDLVAMARAYLNALDMGDLAGCDKH